MKKLLRAWLGIEKNTVAIKQNTQDIEYENGKINTVLEMFGMNPDITKVFVDKE